MGGDRTFLELAVNRGVAPGTFFFFFDGTSEWDDGISGQGNATLWVYCSEKRKLYARWRGLTKV